MRYEFTLTGRSAMLMHADDVEWSDEMSAWRLDPNNTPKKGEGRGDDRRPAHTWIGYCYSDGKQVCIPSANLVSCMKKAGSRVPLGAKNKTFKELAVSGVFLDQENLTFTNAGKPVPFAPIARLKDETEFRAHAEAARKMGFSLFVKRVAVGASKHVRVRPRFETWAVTGTLEVTAHEIKAAELESIFAQAGRIGLGDWRPGSPMSPGPFGMFETKLKKIG